MDQTEMYAKMYAMVLCAASDALDDLARGEQEKAVRRLEDVINDAEDFYLDHRDGTAPMTPVEKVVHMLQMKEMAELEAIIEQEDAMAEK